jgi:NAD(P)H dehydrogenase (quinone)
VYLPFSTSKHAPIASEDQGRVIVALLLQPELCNGQVLDLFGPVELTYAEILNKTSQVLEKDIRYHEVAVDEFVRGFAGNSYRGSPLFAQHITEVIHSHRRGGFAGTNDVVQRLTGQPPMTVERFVEQNKDAFQAQ